MSEQLVRMGTARGRLVLLATVLGSGMAGLDATIVNVALPRIGTDLHAGFTSLQWTVNAYTLTLAGFLLVGGALGDRLGRRRVFLTGVVWFAAASAGCALAPTSGVLIATRALQGIGGALLVPGSLAILESVFVPEDRAAAVGAWSGLGGIATALGPVLGGWLVQDVSWRAAFFNIPMAGVVIVVGIAWVPESDPDARGAHGLDLIGCALAALGLGFAILGLTEGPGSGWPLGDVGALVVGSALLAGFLWREKVTADPLVPLGLFRSRAFSSANAVTFVVYAALGGTFFLLPQALQRVTGFSPVKAGSSLLPITLVMLVLSARAGRLAQRIGPRLPMTFGPWIVAAGLLLLSRVGVGSGYVGTVLPGVVVTALGLSLTVAPLTATVLAAAPERVAGVASAINNDIARVAGLVAVAVLPTLGGVSGAGTVSIARLGHGFRIGEFVSAGLCLLGGLLSFATLGSSLRQPDASGDSTSHSCPVVAPPAAGHTS